MPFRKSTSCFNDGKLSFSFISREKDCGILLYNRKSGEQIAKIPFESGDRRGNVYCREVEGYDHRQIAYRFYEGDREVCDPRAGMYLAADKYGIKREKNKMLAAIPDEDFDWEGTTCPGIPYEEALVYLLHVRGFTRHASSGVKGKGTFSGVAEKIPYLKEIGVTTVELQPAYEFMEIEDRSEQVAGMPYVLPEQEKVNYWGYTGGFYYAPKAAYSSGNDSVREFREMVKRFHQNGMEVVMQFYFPGEVSRFEIPEILRFWALEYRVDGFHLMGNDLPVDLIAQDPLLAETKIWYYSFDVEKIYGSTAPAFANLAFYNDDYLYTMRKFLKGDENMLDTVLFQMRHIPNNSGRIHYMSNYYGMTLMDMVSFDRKHNEENGEENRDGTDYNCSWNCGVEGPSRKKKIWELRRKQIKNAFVLLLMTQSTPLIFMGDEFGNSQKGNNNPYCQDNAVTWLNWKDAEKNRDLLDFWKQMVAFRKKHPLLHTARELKVMDYISCGYPDLSYHGQNAWKPQTEGYNRHVGMMLCGKYAQVNGKEDCFLYLAMNMHWEPHVLGLPKLPKGEKWQQELMTESEEPLNVREDVGEYERLIPERCIGIYISVKDEKGAALGEQKKKTKKKEMS